MRTITDAELTNNFDSVFLEVQAGESFEVTVNGRPVAMISPFDGAPVVNDAEDPRPISR